MRHVALLLAGLGVGLGLVGVVAGCELLVGIKDKTEAAEASTIGSSEDPSVPCSQQPTYLFCDDFDSDSDVEAGDTWLWDISMGGGSIAIDTSQYRTPPRSAMFTVLSGTASAQLGQHVGTPSTSYRLAFDLRVDVTDLSSIPQVGVAQVYRDSSPDQLSVNYVLGPGAQANAQFYEGTSNTQTVVHLDLPPLQTWTRIVLVYDVDQGVSVIEDGKTLGTSAAAAHGPPGSTSIIVGEVYSNPPGAGLVLEVDDVVMRGQ
jgi:hypothetical protein